MRVLYFTRDYTPHDHRFLSALAESGHEIYSLRLERSGRQLEDRPLPAGVTNILWAGGTSPARFRDGLRLRRDLKRVIREFKPDVIHAGPIQKSAFLTALAGFKPLVSMSWGSDMLVDAEKNFFWRAASRYTLKRSAILVGDCRAVQNKAAEFGFPEERCVLFPWGVDLQHFSPTDTSELRKRLGWEDQFVLLCLRSWEPIYGVDIFVKAFARAARQIPELRLLLLGGGSQASQIHKVLDQPDLINRIHYGGQVSQNKLPEYYRAADLYVSPSHSDGSSVSLLEAFASGLPVLVSAIPGNLEWVNEGQQGWFFPDADEDAMLENILRIYKKRSELKEMGKKSRLLAEERADWFKNIKKLLTAYQRAVDMAKK